MSDIQMHEPEQDPQVDGPKHYDGDACMRALEACGLGRDGCLFNIGKYLWRMPEKGNPLQDAKKARWYAQRLTSQGFYGRPISEKENAVMLECANLGFSQLNMVSAGAVRPVIAEVMSLLSNSSESLDAAMRSPVTTHVLRLNDMRGPKFEVLTQVCTGTRRQLEELVSRETVPGYRDGQWSKTFRAGGPLEWFNRPMAHDPDTYFAPVDLDSTLPPHVSTLGGVDDGTQETR